MELVERFLGRRVREFEGGAKIAGFKLKVKVAVFSENGV